MIIFILVKITIQKLKIIPLYLKIPFIYSPISVARLGWLVGCLFFQLDSKGFVADPIFSRYQFYNVTSVKQSIVNLFNVKQNSPKNIKLDLMYVIHFLSVDVLFLLTALNSTNSRVLIFTVYGPNSFIKHSIQLVNSSKTI